MTLFFFFFFGCIVFPDEWRPLWFNRARQIHTNSVELHHLLFLRIKAADASVPDCFFPLPSLLLGLDFGMDKGKSAAKITASLEKLHLDSRPKILLSSSHSISFSLNKKEIETFPFSFIKWIYAKTCAFLFLTELILLFFWFVDFLVFWLIICRTPL